MVYCGSVRIKLGVYTSGIFCFELPKWIKWNKKLLFYKKDQSINLLPDYLSWSSSELLKTDSDQLESVQIHYRFRSVQFHCNIGFPLRWKEGGNISEPIHTVSFPTSLSPRYRPWSIRDRKLGSNQHQKLVLDRTQTGLRWKKYWFLNLGPRFSIWNSFSLGTCIKLLFLFHQY